MTKLYDFYKNFSILSQFLDSVKINVHSDLYVFKNYIFNLLSLGVCLKAAELII